MGMNVILRLCKQSSALFVFDFATTVDLDHIALNSFLTIFDTSSVCGSERLRRAKAAIDMNAAPQLRDKFRIVLDAVFQSGQCFPEVGQSFLSRSKEGTA